MYFNLFKKHYKIFSSFFLCLLFFFSFLFSSSVFAQGGGAAGGTAAPISGCGSSHKKICYSSWNTGGENNSQGGGGKWVYISMSELLERKLITDPDSISYEAIRRGIPLIRGDSADHLSYAGDSQMIRGCGKTDGVYVFISHRYHNNAPVFTPTNDAYGPNKFAYFQFPLYNNKAPVWNNLLQPHEKYVNRAGRFHKSYDEAKDAFEVFRDRSGRNDLTWAEGEFSWFCSYPGPEKKCDPNDPTCDKYQTVIQILILPAMEVKKEKTVLSMIQLVRQRALIFVTPWSQVSLVPPIREIPPQSLKSQISPTLARKTIKNGNPLSLLDLATQFALGMPFVMRHKV